MRRPILLILSLFTLTLHAQTTHSELSIGPEYAIPIGSFRSNSSPVAAPGAIYSYGIGASVKYTYHINSVYGVSLQAGAIRYSSNNKTYSFTSFPIKLGGSFHYKNLFAEPQIGLTSFSGNSTPFESGGTTYGLNIGTYITDHIVLSGNYERWNKAGFGASHLGIRLAYALYIQQATSPRVNKPPVIAKPFNSDYQQSASWQKHRTFKALGWTALGIGLPLTFAGLIATVASIESTHVNRSTAYWLMGSGAALTVSSIPLLILSHKYKIKAKYPD